MVVIDEIELLQEKIGLYMSYIEALEVKIYYESNKKFDNEYDANEMRLSLIRTKVKQSKMKQTLNYLQVEMQDLIDFYIETSKNEIENEQRIDILNN